MPSSSIIVHMHCDCPFQNSFQQQQHLNAINESTLVRTGTRKEEKKHTRAAAAATATHAHKPTKSQLNCVRTEPLTI